MTRLQLVEKIMPSATIVLLAFLSLVVQWQKSLLRDELTRERAATVAAYKKGIEFSSPYMASPSAQLAVGLPKLGASNIVTLFVAERDGKWSVTMVEGTNIVVDGLRRRPAFEWPEKVEEQEL